MTPRATASMPSQATPGRTAAVASACERCSTSYNARKAGSGPCEASRPAAPGAGGRRGGHGQRRVVGLAPGGDRQQAAGAGRRTTGRIALQARHDQRGRGPGGAGGDGGGRPGGGGSPGPGLVPGSVPGEGGSREPVLAPNPDVEGEATALFLTVRAGREG